MAEISTPGETQEKKETGRVEAFSDGVFAIAITLLVLEIRVPHVENEPGAPGLLALLLEQWPSYVAYVVSFLTIGVMWVNHHNLFRYIRRANNPFLFINSVLLMLICAVNFTTALLAEYIREPEEARVAALVYSGLMVVIAIVYNLLWRYASAHYRLLDRKTSPRIIEAINRGYWFGPVMYTVAFLLVFVSVAASIALQAGMAVFFALTDANHNSS